MFRALRPLLITGLSAWALTPVALADVPTLLPVSGTLVDAEGKPYDGQTTVSFALYDTADGGSPVFQTTRYEWFEDGYFSTLLGEETALDPYVFHDSRRLWLGVTVGGDVEMSPRLPMGTTPWAFTSEHTHLADDSELLGGFAADDFRKMSDPVPWSDVSGIPVDQDTLGFLGCADQDYAQFNATTDAWECQAPIEETDPVFGASPAALITTTDVDQLREAHGWGDHGAVGYLTSESDPHFAAAPASGILDQNIANWNQAYAWGNHASVGYLTAETDPIFSASDAAGISSSHIANWTTAYSWGDHGVVGYLTAETDPIFSASPAAGLTSARIDTWTEAYSWGDHADAGYIQVETDPLFASSPAGELTIAQMDEWTQGIQDFYDFETWFDASPLAGITTAMVDAWNTIETLDDSLWSFTQDHFDAIEFVMNHEDDLVMRDDAMLVMGAGVGPIPTTSVFSGAIPVSSSASIATPPASAAGDLPATSGFTLASWYPTTCYIFGNTYYGGSCFYTQWDTALPFPVTVAGVERTTLTVGTEGWISFAGDDLSSSNVALENASISGPLLAFYWDRLAVSEMTAYTWGTAPYRRHIIEYSGVLSDDGSAIQAIIELHETTNDIVVRYPALSGTADGSSATIGFVADQTDAASIFTVGHNNAVLDGSRAEPRWTIAHMR